NDTYIFNRGDGQDVIVDGGQNTIQFGASITPSAVHINQLGNDLIFTFDGSTDRITVSNTGFSSPISQVKFADGTVWNSSQISARTVVAPALNLLKNGQRQFFMPPNSGSYEIDYNASSGFAIAPTNSITFGNPGTTLTIKVSGITAAN